MAKKADTTAVMKKGYLKQMHVEPFWQRVVETPPVALASSGCGPWKSVDPAYDPRTYPGERGLLSHVLTDKLMANDPELYQFYEAELRETQQGVSKFKPTIPSLKHIEEGLTHGVYKACYVRPNFDIPDIISRLCRLLFTPSVPLFCADPCPPHPGVNVGLEFVKPISHGKYGFTFKIKETAGPREFLVKMMLLPKPGPHFSEKQSTKKLAEMVRETMVHSLFDLKCHGKFCPKLYAAGTCHDKYRGELRDGAVPSLTLLNYILSAFVKLKLVKSKKFFMKLMKDVHDEKMFADPQGARTYWHFAVQEFATGGELSSFLEMEPWLKMYGLSTERALVIEAALARKVLAACVAFVRATGLELADLHDRNILFRKPIPWQTLVYERAPLSEKWIIRNVHPILIDFDQAYNIDKQTTTVQDAAINMARTVVEQITESSMTYIGQGGMVQSYGAGTESLQSAMLEAEREHPRRVKQVIRLAQVSYQKSNRPRPQKLAGINPMQAMRQVKPPNIQRKPPNKPMPPWMIRPPVMQPPPPRRIVPPPHLPFQYTPSSSTTTSYTDGASSTFIS